jgi:hypothetical protein
MNLRVPTWGGTPPGSCGLFWREKKVQPRGMTMMADDNRDKDVDNDGDYGDNHYKDVVHLYYA